MGQGQPGPAGCASVPCSRYDGGRCRVETGVPSAMARAARRTFMRLAHRDQHDAQLVSGSRRDHCTVAVASARGHWVYMESVGRP